MSSNRVLAALFCSFLLLSPAVYAQQTTAPSAQAQLLLQRSLAALSSNTALADMTLSGSAHRIAGSDDETGTVVLKAAASGAARLDFNYPSGPRAELRSAATADAPTGAPSGVWSGPDGAKHSIAYHNVINDWGLIPAFTLNNALTAKNAIVTYIGVETHEGQSILHVRTAQQFPEQPSVTGGPQTASKASAFLQHLSEVDIFLDAASLLPVVIAYNTHPDDDAGLDIPIEIRFSDYRTVSGAQIPFHVQKFLNNGLILDLQFQSASLNSGLPASAFSL